MSKLNLGKVKAKHTQKGSSRTFKVSVLALAGMVMFVGGLFAWRNVHPREISVGLLAFPPLSYPGFQVFPTLRTFDAPGTIFRITEDGTRFPVTLLKLEDIQEGTEALVDFEREGTWTGKALATFLTPVRLRGEISLEQDFNVKLQFGTARRHQTFDSSIDTALEKADINWSRPGAYYIIREAISVESFDMHISPTQNLTITAEAGSGAGEATVRGGARGTSSISKVFDVPHYIFFTAEELIKAEGFQEAEVFRVKNNDLITWASEEDE